MEAINREKILVQKKREGRGFRGVFGKVETYIMYVFSIYDLQVQRLGMETFRSLATKETEAEQQVSAVGSKSILRWCDCMQGARAIQRAETRFLASLERSTAERRAANKPTVYEDRY